MYDELVKRLRSQCQGYGKECEDCNADGNCRSQMENEAADAIEELSKRSECPCWYGDIRFCSMLGKPIPEPPKEEA